MKGATKVHHKPTRNISTKVAKKATKVAKALRAAAPAARTAPVAPQTRALTTANAQKKVTSLSQPTIFQAQPQQPLTTMSLFKQQSPFAAQRRNMSVLTGMAMKVMVPCDPRFQDDEVCSVLNAKTGLIEPVIIMVPEISFEWVFSSPCDLHTFDVIPVVKDCIDPAHPVLEGMDA